MNGCSRSLGSSSCLPNNPPAHMGQDSSLEVRVRRRLTEWTTAGLLRTLRPPAGFDFASNDYLNLSTHPVIADRMARAVGVEGCGSTGSRLLRGERTAFHAIEERFARFKGTERALYFSS